MKKTLLCLFLLSTFTFYSQVANMVHCAGDTAFNLTYQYSALIGNLNPAETTVSYHLTLDDATNGVNTISNPTNFISTIASQIIYARINHLGTITTNYFNLIVNPTFVVTAMISKPIDCMSNAILTVTVTGGQAPYTYAINNGPYSNSASSSIITISNLVAGTYTIVVKDAIGCINSNFIVISPLVPLSATFTKTDVHCNGNNDGSITVNATGGQAPYVYSLDNGMTYVSTNVFTNLTTGTYNITVKDALNCTSSMVATIMEPAALTATTVLTKPIDCIGNATVTAAATGGQAPYTYSINNSPYSSSTIFSNLVAGTYSITVKDANGCVTLNSVVISPLVSLIATIIKTDIHCNGNNDGSITVNATGGQAPYVYSLDGVTYVSSPVFTNLTTGTYNITVKDALNCTSSMVATIVEPAALSATTVITKPIDCISNATATVATTGGQAPYTYSINNSPYSSSTIFSNLVAGVYSITVKDAIGCITTNSVVISPLVTLRATIIKTDVHCNGNNDGTITVNATGGQPPYIYSLENNVGIPITGNQSTNVFSGLSAGSYGVKVADANGCLILQTGINILEPTPIVANFSITPITCNNDKGTLTVSAIGGTTPYQYSLDNGITYVATDVFSNVVSGTYTIVVRDAHNCTFSLTATVTPVSYPTPIAVVSKPTCNGDNNGSITVTTIGGQAPYQYSSNGSTFQTSNTINNLYAGVHTIQVIDFNSCTSIISIVMTEPAPLSAIATTSNQTVTINATGGSAEYDYSLNGATYQASNVFTNVTYGNSQVFVKDTNGCIFMTNTLVNPPAPLINGSNIINQNFTQGQTLADLIVPGENIKWYSNSNATTTKKSKKTAETPLPLSTVLVNNTTYYASQTINGIESTERLAVTVKLGALGTNDFVIKDFTFYPNPVKNIFTISNTSIIDEVSLISIKGETLLTKQINNLRSEIDLSNFSKGVYFLKVKSEGTEKTVKLLKE